MKCDFKAEAATDEELLKRAAKYTKDVHGMASIDPHHFGKSEERDQKGVIPRPLSHHIADRSGYEWPPSAMEAGYTIKKAYLTLDGKPVDPGRLRTSSMVGAKARL